MSPWTTNTGQWACSAQGPEERLRALLAANAAIASDLSLQVLLTRIVDAARDLVGARYAAIGVVGSGGELEEFVYTGIAGRAARSIGRLPHGVGILGLLTTHPAPIRLVDLTAHPTSAGFPAHHPPMSRFLGVPIRIRDEVFGNLYLTEPRHDGGFTADDEAVVVALAATAGVAIANARSYDESEQRRLWSTAAGEMTRRLLGATGPATDGLLVDDLAFTADADVAFLARSSDGQVTAAAGPDAAPWRGRIPDRLGSVVLWHDTGRDGARGASGVELGSAVVVPLRVAGVTIGALCIVRRRERRRYAPRDRDLVEGFADQWSLALELGRARAGQQELERLADRDRIARDLHDHVIQELYALGMGLQQMVPVTAEPAHAARLDAYVDTVDATIHRIRSTIFALTPLDHDTSGLQSQVLEVVDRESDLLGFRPAVVFRGPLDAIGDPALTDDVVAVVRESLSNCARHATATRIQLSVSMQGDDVRVEVVDDGRGLADRSVRSSGLANLRHRAQARQGDLTFGDSAAGGAHLTWTARWTTPR